MKSRVLTSTPSRSPSCTIVPRRSPRRWVSDCSHTGFSPNIMVSGMTIRARFRRRRAAGRPGGAHSRAPRIDTSPSKRRSRPIVPRRAIVIAVNDPYAGGTHSSRPDARGAGAFPAGRLLGFVANRAHHADIGGMTPGSMPLAREIYQEGFRLPPVRPVRGGELVEDVLTSVPRQHAGSRRASRRSRCAAWGPRRRCRTVGRVCRRARRADARTRDERAPGVQRTSHGGDACARCRAACTAPRIASTTTASGVPQSRFAWRSISAGDGAGRFHRHGATGRRELERQLRHHVVGGVMYVFTALGREAIPPNDGVMRRLDVHAPAGASSTPTFRRRSPAATWRRHSASSTSCCGRSRRRRRIGSRPRAVDR